MRLLLIFLLSLPLTTVVFALTDAEVEHELSALVKEIAPRLPQGSDASMVVSMTAGPGRRLSYVSISALPAREWTAAMKAHSRRIAINDYCTNPSMTDFRIYRVVASWQHSDREGRHIVTNTVSPTDCR